MATNLDLTHAMRGKIMAALKADAALAAIVGNRIYPQAVPAKPIYPFVKLGAAITTPLFIDGNDGTQYSSAAHCFTQKGDDPEVEALTINSEIVRILNAMEVSSIGASLTMDVTTRQAQVMQDGDADAFHGFVTFDANAS